MYRAHIMAAFVCLFSVAPSQAAFVVSISSGTTTVGSPAQLAVTITSDVPGGELLDVFGLELRITRLSGAGELRFTDPQSSAELSRPNYVFGADSGNASVPGATSVLITTTVTTNDTYLGGDGTLSGTGATVGSSPLLLAVLDLDTKHTGAGDRYQVSLIDGPSTVFYDPSVTARDWSAGSGILDVQGGALSPAPAPEGSVLVLTGAAFLGVLRLRRRWASSLGARASDSCVSASEKLFGSAPC